MLWLILLCLMKQVLMNLVFTTNGPNQSRFSDLLFCRRTNSFSLVASWLMPVVVSCCVASVPVLDCRLINWTLSGGADHTKESSRLLLNGCELGHGPHTFTGTVSHTDRVDKTSQPSAHPRQLTVSADVDLTMLQPLLQSQRWNNSASPFMPIWRLYRQWGIRKMQQAYTGCKRGTFLCSATLYDKQHTEGD